MTTRHRISTSLIVGLSLLGAACADPADGRGDFGMPGPDGGGKADTDGDGVVPDPGADQAPCAAAGNIEVRLDACQRQFPGEELLLPVGTRPTDASDLHYYVNRWYSIDPCFPAAPVQTSLEVYRSEHINQAENREPGMLEVCGVYDFGVQPDLEPRPIPAEHTDGDTERLRSDAWRDGFLPMFEAAQTEAQVELVVISGFRSADTQVGTFAYWTQYEGGDVDAAAVYSAQPLHSEHQLGTTADVSFRANGVVHDVFANPMGFHRSPAGQWIVANAHRFGIVVTYEPHKVHVHQYKAEPWHLRYVGRPLAELAHACDLSTEEILSNHYGIDVPLPEFSNMNGVYADTRNDGWTSATCDDYGPLAGQDGDDGGDDGDPPPTDSSFCQGLQNGGWCDGGDAVECQAGLEVSRQACQQGCCSFTFGTPDQCSEDLSEAQRAQALECSPA